MILPLRNQVLAGRHRSSDEKLLFFGSSTSSAPSEMETGRHCRPCWAPHACALCKRQREGEGQGAPLGAPRRRKPPSPQNAIFLQGWEQREAGAQRVHASLRAGGRDRGSQQAEEQLQRFTPPSTALSYRTLTFSGQGCDDGQGQEGLQGGHFQQCAAQGA